MITVKKLIIISTILLFINSCSEESSMFDPTYFGDGFKGITFTGEADPTPFKGDPTDWCSGANGILGKNNDTSGTDDGFPIPLYFNFGAAFPNPITINESTTIPFAIPQQMFANIYVINKEYRVVAVLINRMLEPGSYQVELDSKQIGAAGVYRVVFESENIYCKGDIWIKGSLEYH